MNRYPEEGAGIALLSWVRRFWMQKWIFIIPSQPNLMLQLVLQFFEGFLYDAPPPCFPFSGTGGGSFRHHPSRLLLNHPRAGTPSWGVRFWGTTHPNRDPGGNENASPSADPDFPAIFQNSQSRTSCILRRQVFRT